MVSGGGLILQQGEKLLKLGQDNGSLSRERIFFEGKMYIYCMIINSLAYGMLLCGSTRKENEFSLRVRQ